MCLPLPWVGRYIEQKKYLVIQVAAREADEVVTHCKQLLAHDAILQGGEGGEIHSSSKIRVNETMHKREAVHK